MSLQLGRQKTVDTRVNMEIYIVTNRHVCNALTNCPSDPHPHEWTLQSCASASMWKSPEAKECTGKLRKYRTSTGTFCVFFEAALLLALLSLSVPSLPKLVAPKVYTLPSVESIAL